MTNWALGGNIEKIVQLYNGGNSSTVADTKGAWYDFTTGEDYDIHGLTLTSYSMTYEQHEFLGDLGIGSTPDILINNLGFSRRETRTGQGFFHLPIFIPKNTQVQWRQQCDYSGTIAFGITALAWVGGRFGVHQPFTKVLTYGANTGDSGGTLVDSGAVANTFGNYVQFASGGLPHTIQGFILYIGARNDYARTNTHWYIDVAKNNGSEETLIDQWLVGCGDQTDNPLPQASPFFPIRVEKGEDFSVRCKCSATSSDRYIDAILYCFA